MMLKEVLLLVLVGWMVMPAHPWKPPEHVYGNDDTTDKLDRPSPQDTQKNIRNHRNYIHHRYGDNNPTGPEIFRQLRQNPGKAQPKKSNPEKRKEYDKELKRKSGKANPMKSAWKTCEELSKKIAKATRGNSHTDIKSFDQFKSKFNKKYGNETEEADRKKNFQKNFQDITDHNVQYKLRKKSYMKQVSYYSDWTKGEFINKDVGCIKAPDFSAERHGRYRKKRSKDAKQYLPKMEGKEPESIDYKQCGAIDIVRDQKGCASCWAFSVVSTIESQIFLKHRKKLHLSEQEMVDCSPGNCDGGWPSEVIQYYMGKAIALRDTYPYTAENKERVNGGCKYDAPKAGYKVSAMIKPDNDAHLLNALVHKGPISVVIYTSWNFNHYREGVLDDELCTKNRAVNHAVTLIGYGTENGKKYWLLRNSHGEDMGEGGYFKLARDKVNHCKISDYAYIPEIQ